MYFKIVTNDSIPFKKRIKRTNLYFFVRYSSYRNWKNRFTTIFKLHPGYNNALDKATERSHVKLWKVFRIKPSLNTLRICNNISNQTDKYIVPEEIFVSDIEPSLNNISEVKYISIKSFYNKWFDEGLFPKDYFHRINGEYLDQNLNPISKNDARNIAETIDFPVVLKPNYGSFGGDGVYFLENRKALLDKSDQLINFVVQEKIDQHPDLSAFHNYGLNTCRVCVYKSVSNNQIHVLNAALRMGVDGSLDNETAGGIVSYITTDGELHGFAVDKYGKKFFKHPNSGLTFDQKIPNYDQLLEVSKQVAGRVYFARLVSLDLCYDCSGKWRPIEINLGGQTIRFAQYAGQPFFGDLTEEVIEYCIKNHWALK